MDKSDFLNLLDSATRTLEQEAISSGFKSSPQFENRVREVLSNEIITRNLDVSVDFESHVQAFPDICLGKFGIEVKFTEKDTWRGIANSVSQGMKDNQVDTIYILWCKMGGTPEIRYRPYEEAVMHVRTSHVPRFEVDMETDRSLFKLFKISYAEFSALSMEYKMNLIRRYARQRLREGVKIFFWWLETQTVDPLHNNTVSLYTDLPSKIKIELMWEELILFPNILISANKSSEFDTRIQYFFNKHRVLYPQYFCLYENVLNEIKGDISLSDFIIKNSNEIRKICDNIDINTFRECCDWWSESEISSYDMWTNYTLTMIKDTGSNELP